MFYYCAVTFPGSPGDIYFYRTNCKDLPTGAEVVVPVGPYGLRKVARVAYVKGYRLRELPRPLSKTKWMCPLSTPSSPEKIERYNQRIIRAAIRRKQRQAEINRELSLIDDLEALDAFFCD